MVPIELGYLDLRIKVYALLDGASTISLLDSSVVKMLKLQTSFSNARIKGIAGKSALLSSNRKTSLKCFCVNGQFNISNIYVIENLSLPTQIIDNSLVNLCFARTGVLTNSYNAVPLILLGQDHCGLIFTRECREILNDDLVVSRCSLGWSIHGRNDYLRVEQVNVSSLGKNDQKSCSVVHSRIEEKVNGLIESYFDIDALGVSTSVEPISPLQRAQEILDSTSRFNQGSWEVGLLWKSNNTKFPNGKANALRRLELLEKRLDRDPVYADLYYKEMERLFNCNYAEKLPFVANPKRVFYIPHFGVFNPNKPNKVRLVFDAAAKSGSTSLNQLLLQGPDYLKSLLGVLMRFRQFSFAVKADIKDMFMKINVIPSDRDAQRFFWRGRDRTCQPKEFRMRVLLFGAKSSPCTAIFIKNKNALQFSSQYPKASNKIINNSYMDDYLDSFSDAEEASKIIGQIKKINEHAGFLMHSWGSNNVSILHEISSISCDDQIINSDKLVIENGKVLGLKWESSLDRFAFNLDFLKIPQEIYLGLVHPTKRQILSVVMSVFDPLGFLLPFTIQSRFLLQQIWESKVLWDDKIFESELKLWKRWLFDLEKIKSVRIDRCYQLSNHQVHKAELHVFADASKRGYSAVAYWRFVVGESMVRVSFIIAKTRIISLSANHSIPRLELQAALLAVRLAELVAKEHEFFIIQRFFWSDSTTVISWINKDPKEFKVFFSNRLEEIRKKSRISEWNWIPSDVNPADDGTKYKPEALLNDSIWLAGPKFLRSPSWSKFVTPKSDSRMELYEDNLETVLVCNSEIEVPLIDSTRFSSWTRLISNLAKVLQAVDIWLKRTRSRLQLFQEAENICIRSSQSKSFSSEISSLQKGILISKSSRILCLNPFLDDQGILRSNSRIQTILDEKISNKPIILESKEHFSILLINHFHSKFYHASHETVLNELRQQFWIIGLRQALKKVVSKCTICKFLRANPTQPQMAPLPNVRLGFRLKPFSYCGIDYFGPIQVKIGRRLEKRWGALFTCLTIRAIHIELVSSLNASSAIMAFRRFSARRGTPLKIYSDNATNFKAMNKELKEAMKNFDYNKITEFATINKFDWKFNPPTASNMGGSWERLIRSVKTALFSVIKDRHPKEEVLLTFLVEIEHSVNSRPLTHVTSDSRDMEALTPNHFLIGTSSGQIKLPRYDSKAINFRDQWKLAQQYADLFWVRWLNEYLPTLHTRKKWYDVQPPLKINDVVIVVDKNMPRNQWHRGVVLQVFPSKQDNQVRVVEIRLANGSKWNRPSNKLIQIC